MPSQAESQFAPSCPYCQGTGVPHEVAIKKHERTVTFLCDTCKRDWTTTDHPLSNGSSESSPSA